MTFDGKLDGNTNVDSLSSNSQFLKTYVETKKWLDNIGIKDYTINDETLVVDAPNGVIIVNNAITSLKVKFGNCGDWRMFQISCPKLNTLVGTPDHVKALSCRGTKIKNFVGLNSVEQIYAEKLKYLKSFEGLPNKVEIIDIYGSCYGVESITNFPKTITGTLYIGIDFKWIPSLYKHMDELHSIILWGDHRIYDNILPLLRIKGISLIKFASSSALSDILNAEINRQPDPRKRNLLKVAQELSNAGFHHLTV